MRLIFMLYHFGQLTSLRLYDWIKILTLGGWMDLSMIGYILLLSGILISFLFFSGKITQIVFKYFNLFLLTFFVLLLVSDMELYRHWGYRIDATPLFYLKTPEEAFASLKFWLILILFLFSLLIIFSFYKFYHFIIGRIRLENGRWWIVPIFLFLSATMIIPIRGGLGVAPMNPGKVYFSQNVFVNHAALNGVWNMVYGLSMLKSMGKQYPDYISAEDAEKYINSFGFKNDDAPKVLNTRKPNIVVILLESFTSKFIEPLGGMEGVTPNLNKLSEQGLLFSNIYASGDRSDKGLVSVLGGFPAQSTQSIMLYPPKSIKLPTLSRSLYSMGYNTNFYYGGDPDFANIRTFLYSARFNKIISQSDFPRSLNFGKWGVPDEHVFQKLLSDLDEAEKPFFKFFFTLSSHEPFEFPDESAFPGHNTVDKYASSIYYTDHWLGWFFNEVSKKPYWNNTLFILLADHGHRLPGNNKIYEPEKFSIPMLWLGGTLDTIGVVPQIGSQIDLVRTLLYQLDVDANEFVFSRNLLSNSNKQFAYYAFNDGFGFITDSCQFIWDHRGQIEILDNCNEEKRKEAFSYFRYYHNFFLGL
jgi:phosphoglycerol transferase MdoB-like AlkP superfamily enzyme